jgi:hypothetical protein
LPAAPSNSRRRAAHCFRKLARHSALCWTQIQSPSRNAAIPWSWSLAFPFDDTESEDRWFHHAVVIENPNRGWIVEAQVTVSYLSASGELLDGITASSIRLVDILPGARVASVDERQYMERDEDVDHLAIELEVLSWQTIEGPVGNLAFSNVTTTSSDHAPGWYDTY